MTLLKVLDNLLIRIISIWFACTFFTLGISYAGVYSLSAQALAPIRKIENSLPEEVVPQGPKTPQNAPAGSLGSARPDRLVDIDMLQLYLDRAVDIICRIQPHDTVLIIGGGIWGLTSRLKEKGIKVAFVHNSEDVLGVEKAYCEGIDGPPPVFVKEYAKYLKPDNKDLRPLTREKGGFDIVLALDGVEPCSISDHALLIKRIIDLVADGGVVYVSSEEGFFDNKKFFSHEALLQDEIKRRGYSGSRVTYLGGKKPAGITTMYARYSINYPFKIKKPPTADLSAEERVVRLGHIIEKEPQELREDDLQYMKQTAEYFGFREHGYFISLIIEVREARSRKEKPQGLKKLIAEASNALYILAVAELRSEGLSEVSSCALTVVENVQLGLYHGLLHAADDTNVALELQDANLRNEFSTRQEPFRRFNCLLDAWTGVFSQRNIISSRPEFTLSLINGLIRCLEEIAESRSRVDKWIDANMDSAAAKSYYEQTARARLETENKLEMLKMLQTETLTVKSKKPININEIIGRCAKAAEVSASDIEISCSLDEDLPAIYANEASISLLCQNLISNAVDFLWMKYPDLLRSGHVSDADPRQGRLIITTRFIKEDKADFVEARFEDNGPGIEEDMLDSNRLFEKSATSRMEDGGTGLGLYLVRQIVDEYDGTIDVSSVAGEGAVFTVRLPITERGPEPDWQMEVNLDYNRLQQARRQIESVEEGGPLSDEAQRVWDSPEIALWGETLTPKIYYELYASLPKSGPAREQGRQALTAIVDEAVKKKAKEDLGIDWNFCLRTDDLGRNIIGFLLECSKADTRYILDNMAAILQDEGLKGHIKDILDLRFKMMQETQEFGGRIFGALSIEDRIRSGIRFKDEYEFGVTLMNDFGKLWYGTKGYMATIGAAYNRVASGDIDRAKREYYMAMWTTEDPDERKAIAERISLELSALEAQQEEIGTFTVEDIAAIREYLAEEFNLSPAPPARVPAPANCITAGCP